MFARYFKKIPKEPTITDPMSTPTNNKNPTNKKVSQSPVSPTMAHYTTGVWLKYKEGKIYFAYHSSLIARNFFFVI